MTATSSWAKWRDTPIVPEGYDDVAQLVRLARRARKQIIEFEWRFSEQVLRSLRENVHESFSGVVGRYKTFAARVLAAVNQALGEHDTVYFLAEPRNARAVDCALECALEGTDYRLHGHASFDLVFSLRAQDTVEQGPSSPTHAGAIASAVRSLGWDPDRMEDPRLAPVIRVLYGLPLNYGGGEVLPAPGPAEDLPVHFGGPFGALDKADLPCLFTHPVARESGVYIWTVLVGGEDLPWYVGQTRRGFGRRMGEHLAAYLSGQYDAFDAGALALGSQSVFWRARADDGGWPQCMPLFLRDYETNASRILAMIRLVRFHVAPVAGDAHRLGRVEGAVGRHFKANEDKRVQGFFTSGIKLPSPVPNDKPLRLLITSEGKIAGLPTELPG